jgi:hypothetical protein
MYFNFRKKTGISIEISLLVNVPVLSFFITWSLLNYIVCKSMLP